MSVIVLDVSISLSALDLDERKLKPVSSVVILDLIMKN